MIIPTIPKSMANQSITLHLKTNETDDWGKPVLKDIEISHCVVQPQTIYSGSNNSRMITANAVIFLYTGITTPMPNLDRESVGSEVTFEEKRYSITNIVDNRDPFSNDVYSYEIEVL